jgi:GntR family transcriptional regulator
MQDVEVHGVAAAVCYRIMNTEPDIAAVPDSLRSRVEAALAKEAQNRPTADDLLRQLTHTSHQPRGGYDVPTRAILAQTWRPAATIPLAAAAPALPEDSHSPGLRPARVYDANMNSTRPTMAIDHSSSVPLHEQVAAAVRRAIADSEVLPGGRLPPARDLAAVLGVNTNTVFRGLRTLRDEGLLEFRRGRGVTVTGIGPERSALMAKARELVALARRYGYRPEELAEIIARVS